MNEVAHGYDSAKTLYFHVYRFSDKYIYSSTNSAYEAVGTWNDARAQACDIAMTAAGDTHFGNFPASARDVYFVLIKEQVTGTQLASDREVGQGVMYWDGEKELNDLTEVLGWLKNG